MTQLFQVGNTNTTGLVVPDLYVGIVPPAPIAIAGAPTNVVGVVGTATWGPVGSPVIVGNMTAQVNNYGNPQPRKYDMGTQVATAILQGASNFRCVRVTDGTDTAATAAIGAAGNAFSVSAIYTGSLGSNIGLTLLPGTAANSFKAIVALPGLVPETYDNIQGAGMPWLPTTRYRVGQITTNGANTYVCIAGGNSAASGGPIGTGTAIADGTVRWNFQNALGPATVAGTFWANVVSAINSGTGPQRGASQLVVASPGSGSGMPPVSGGPAWAPNTAYIVGQYVTNAGNSYLATAGGTSAVSPATGPSTTGASITDGTVTWAYQKMTFSLSGGSDGATTITAATLVGVDVAPRTGMYALRSQGCSLGVLADTDDSTQWTTQAAYGLSEGTYMVLIGPSGDNILNAIATKASAGLDSYSAKLMFGDWITWNDPWLGVARVVSPQGFEAGRLANLSPEQSSLNKQMFGIVASQKSTAAGPTGSGTYAVADLQALFGTSIDVIANPCPGGAYWGARLGHNSSSNPAINGDNYTRLTNYIAASLGMTGVLGTFVGQVIDQAFFRNVRAACLGFFQNMLSQRLLVSLDGSLPFSVVCDASNNPQSRTSLGFGQVDCQVQFGAINEKFIVNVQGGVTVSVSRTTTQAGQVIS